MSKSLFAYFQGSWKKGIPYIYIGNTWKEVLKINASTSTGWKPEKHVHTPVTIAAVASTCTTIGYTSGEKCAECNELLIEPQPIPALEHQWTAWAVTKEPTEDLEGEQQRSCTQCSATETASVPKLDHIHDYTVDSGIQAVEATCTSPRYNFKQCACGYNPEDTNYIIATGTALGHAWKAATCVRPKTCERCEATEGSATGSHDFNNKILWSTERQLRSAATCTEDATYWVECSNCNTDTHEDNNSSTNAYFTASQCSEAYDTRTYKLGHNWADATCTAPKTCTRCSTTEGEALGHSPATTATWGSHCSSASVACTRSGCEMTWSGEPSQVTTQEADCITKRKYKHTVTININGTNKEFTCNEQHTGSVDLTTHNAQCTFVADKQSHQCGHYSKCDMLVETHSYPGPDGYYLIPLENGTQHQAAVDCINCGYTKTGATKNCTYTTTKAATCTTSGTKTCEDCDRTVPIEALGHTWNNGVCTTCSTTCNHSYTGTNCRRTCRICGMVNTFHSDPDGNGTCNICGATVFIEK